MVTNLFMYHHKQNLSKTADMLKGLQYKSK